MTSILTNTSATIALQTLRSINQQLDATSNRVSTGQRISSAADGAAYWSIASTLKSDNGSLSSLKDAMSLDKNSIDAASAGLNKVIDQLTAIKNAMTSATSEQADKSKLQNDITVALNAIQTYSDNTVMNGSNWLSVQSDAAGFAATKNLVAAYSRVGTTVSVSKTQLDTSSFVLFDKKALASTGGNAASTVALNNIATYASTTGGATVAVKTDVASTAYYKAGFMDTTYTVSNVPGNIYTSVAATGSALTTKASGTPAPTTATALSGTGTSDSLTTNIAVGDTLVVNGTTISFISGATSGNQISVTDTVGTLLSKIDAITGGSGSAISSGGLSIQTGTASDLTLTGSAVAKLGLTSVASTARTATPSQSASVDTSISKMNITNASQPQISAYLKIVDATTQQLLTGASKLGSMSTLLKAQSDFTQQLIDINTSSIGSLVDANIEEESTKLKALQTQQQLGIQSLSIANSSSQNVLSLFR